MNFSDFFEAHKLVPRSQQTEILDTLSPVWEQYKYIAISAPTGVGKTYVALAIADAIPKSYILTSTKDLQIQYERSSAKVVDIKGRNNYTCQINPLFQVDEAPCLANKPMKGDCIRKGICDYYRQKTKARNSQIMITNYSYFLAATGRGCASDQDQDEPEWLARDVLVMDEAHDLEKHLVSIAEAKLNFNDLFKNFGLGDPNWRVSDDMEENRPNLVRLFEDMSKAIEDFDEKIASTLKEGTWMQRGKSAEIPKSVNEKIKKMNAKKQILSGYKSNLMYYLEDSDPIENPWVETINSEENSMILSPLTAKHLFNRCMDHMANKFVFMSATMPPADVLCKELGIARDEMLFIEVGTPFDAEKSPIVALPITKMNFKEIDRGIPLIIDAVSAIMANHPTEKGLIHTGNYKVAKAILDGTDRDTRDRLIARDMSGLNKVHNSELLKMHYSTSDPTVLLSPSMTTGIDLYDDMARFQIIVKLPFLSLADPRIKKKSELFPEWYLMQMWVEVMQSAGRATRNEDDYSTTYILDASFEYFYEKAKKKLPAWFKDRIQF